jgi:hypothetical protein
MFNPINKMFIGSNGIIHSISTYKPINITNGLAGNRWRHLETMAHHWILAVAPLRSVANLGFVKQQA